MGNGHFMMRRAVFLDRDGVLNRALVRKGLPYPPRQLTELEILPDVPQALVQLRALDFALIVVTNQPDVARGTVSRDAVKAINDRLTAVLPLDVILTCFHDEGDNCVCRKPKPGFMYQMRDERGISLGHSYMIGDRWRDIDAGRNAGCRTVFIDRGYAERWPLGAADHVCASLGEAAHWIASLPKPRGLE
jgi:D-glycero-D-manno-heptose 1,7-bisphosphate phosphatase